MNFVDRTLVRLGDAQTRGLLFDDASLEQLLATAYDLESLPVEGPFSPSFERFQIGLTQRQHGALEGQWGPTGSAERAEARLTISGLGATDRVRIDALWSGSITARTTFAPSRIDSVGVATPTLHQVDASIIAEQGQLPADPAALEEARRDALIAIVQDRLGPPQTFNSAVLNKWLDAAAATSVEDLIASENGRPISGALQIHFEDTDLPTPQPKPLPFIAALLIRGNEFSVAELMEDSDRVRSHMATLGLQKNNSEALPVRNPLVVAWVVPEEVFDDADWPGADDSMNEQESRAARRRTAGRWLAEQGIGLVAA